MGARGRLVLIRSLLAGDLKPSDALNERVFSCILCGACTKACPLGIDIPEAVYLGRSILKDSDRQRRLLRYLAKFSAKWPDLSFRIMKISRNLLFPLLARRGYLPFQPDFPEKSFRDSEQVHKVPKKRGRVAIFTGCSVNYLFPSLGESLIHVLRSMSYEVILPKGEACCGSPLRALGLEAEAVTLAKKNFQIFSKLKVDAVLSLCPTCTFTLKSEYPKLIGHGLEKATDISAFFLDKLGPTDPIRKTAVYHDPCHLAHGLGIKKEPREIIKKAGFELLDAGASECCGFGGVFCASYQNISKNLLQKSAKKLLDTQAEAVVTSCPGCMLQLGQQITDRPVLHLVELIEEAYCLRPVETKG
jgi:glycolate oxidase iron-sulfur subunit